MERGDIYLVSLDPTSGHEQQGTHPVLVISSSAGVIRCDQPRTLDLISRKARKLEKVPKIIIDEVLAKLVTIFE